MNVFAGQLSDTDGPLNWQPKALVTSMRFAPRSTVSATSVVPAHGDDCAGVQT